MPNYQKRIVYLSNEQRQELFTNGTITVNGQTITYSDNDMYVTPQEVPYVKPANGIPASDLDPNALDSKADKNNTTITGSLSMYRKADTQIGTASAALGANGTASGIYSTAFGNTTVASGTSSFAIGTNTEANGVNSVAEGNYAITDGRNAHAAGEYTRANGRASFVRGRANVLNTASIFPEWAADTKYVQYDRVKVIVESNGETTVTLYMCTTDHTSTSTFDSSKWEDVTEYKDYADVVGNGHNGSERSNAYALDWNGNAYFKGDVYVGCDDDSTGGSVLPRVDDTAGSGDTDKIWSADKMAEILDTIVIQLETEKSGFHNISPTSILFYPDSRLENVTAKYSASKNIVTGIYATGTTNGITKKLSGLLLGLSGTGTGQQFIINKNDAETVDAIKGKTFNAYLYIKKATAWAISTSFFFYDGVGVYKKKYFGSGSTKYIGWTDLGEITFSNNANQLMFKFDSLNGETFITGDCIWVGLYETSLTDTEQTVTGEDPYVLSVSGLNSVDTATHESTAKYVEPTKEYVDNHIPDIKTYWTDEIYALPEKFGAIGDGITDDTQSLNDCFTYAATSGKAVRGYGKYKISSTIVLGMRYLDAYLREIIYTGSGTAISLENADIVFDFHRIQSGGIGISFGGSNPYARRCQVKGNEINSASHCIETNDYTLYCTCEIRNLSSSNGDCIHHTITSAFGGNEFVYRGSSCSCPNGYVTYDVWDSKLYDFTVEADCKYGLRRPSNCTCIGWRHREQVDGIRNRIINNSATHNNGPLIRNITSNDGIYGFKYIANDPLPWYSIDNTEIQSYEALPASGQGSIDPWHKSGFNGIELGVPIRGIENWSHNIIGEKCYFISGYMVITPPGRKKNVLNTSSIDFKKLDGRTDEEILAGYSIVRHLATDYVTGVQHTDIYFNSFFGAIGYNDITLTQENGYTATIYDKLGNVLFDGTNEGNGKWHFRCVMDYSSNGRYQDSSQTWWCYDGTNEYWEIEKLL